MRLIIELPLVCASGFYVQRSVVRFLTAENISAEKIYRRLVNVYGTSAMPDQTLRSWVERFKTGRNNVHDDVRNGRPTDTVNDETTAAILALFERDRRYTISDSHFFFKWGVSHQRFTSSICRILQETGYMKVVHAGCCGCCPMSIVRIILKLLSSSSPLIKRSLPSCLVLLLVMKVGYIMLHPKQRRRAKCGS